MTVTKMMQIQNDWEARGHEVHVEELFGEGGRVVEQYLVVDETTVAQTGDPSEMIPLRPGQLTNLERREMRRAGVA